jgi:hypothetical protein
MWHFDLDECIYDVFLSSIVYEKFLVCVNTMILSYGWNVLFSKTNINYGNSITIWYALFCVNNNLP